MPNPFHPTFGATPPLLVGRDRLIQEFLDGIDDGPGAAARATFYTGARGSGKTVLLNEIEDRVRELGWLVLSETASAGFIARITKELLPSLLRQWGPDAVPQEAGLRSQLTALTDILREHGTGLLITLDEVHRNEIAELRELFTVLQHAIRENREVAFAGAGLASSISDVVNDEVLSFLRRAERHTLGRMTSVDARRALERPIIDAGRTATTRALETMVEGSHGYPFLIQLVGAQTWAVRRTARDITDADAREGVDRARRRLGPLLHEPALARTSRRDRAFLLAMAQDSGSSRMGDISARLGVDAGYAGQYRLRLLAVEVIESVGYGEVAFAIPYMRDSVLALGSPDS